MSIRFLGIDIYISVPFSVMLAFLLFMDTTGFMSASLLAVIMHESGHLVAMKLTRCLPKSISCTIGGVTIIGNAYTAVKDSVIISLSGPLVNIAMALILWIVGEATNNTLILAFSVVQLLVGAMNLLPVKGLDGGTVLRLLLKKQSKVNTELVCTVVSIVTACVVLVAGLAVVVKNVSNPSLLLLGIYLIIINITKY